MSDDCKHEPEEDCPNCTMCDEGGLMQNAIEEYYEQELSDLRNALRHVEIVRDAALSYTAEDVASGAVAILEGLVKDDSPQQLARAVYEARGMREREGT